MENMRDMRGTKDILTESLFSETKRCGIAAGGEAPRPFFLSVFAPNTCCVCKEKAAALVRG